jgi:hypothetical protein
VLCTERNGAVTMAGVLPKYFSSEWSFAQFHVPEETKAIVAFGPQKNTVIIVCANGRCAYFLLLVIMYCLLLHSVFRTSAENNCSYENLLGLEN